MEYYDEIEITTEDFLPYLKWCLLKFQNDPSSRRGTGGIEYKIGGFLDRFSNQCINWILFNHLLKNKDFKIDPDYFLYAKTSAKKCADIIGLCAKNGKKIPLSYFNKTKWEHVEGAPFIELKTLRRDQKIAHLGMTQYNDNNYYAYVESHFDELYLFKLIQGFDSQSHDITMSSVYIKDNSENILLSPEIIPPEKIATIRLLGIYKGKDLKEHNLEFPQGKKPRYVSEIKKINENEMKIPKEKQILESISTQRFIYDPKNECNNEWLPIYTDGKSIDLIYHKTKEKTKGHMFIRVNRNTFLNEYALDSGLYRIIFKVFDRSGKETELFNHKSIYDSKNHRNDSHPKDCTNELISELTSFYERESKKL